VALVCFALVHISPGDPLISVLPADASVELQQMLLTLYGFDRSYPEQFVRWLGRALIGRSRHLDRVGPPRRHRGLPRRRQHPAPGRRRHRHRLLPRLPVRLRRRLFQQFLGRQGRLHARRARRLVPHYWLGMVLVIIFSAQLGWLPATGAGPGGSGQWTWDWAHFQFLILPPSPCR
jgi:peptide/nickel transport system permease protein